MKFVNENKLELKSSLDYTSKKTIGIIFKTAEKLGISNRLGLFLPKLMFSLPADQIKGKAVEGTHRIDYGMIVNHANNRIGDGSAKYRNYSIVNCIGPTNATIPQYAEYEKVFVDFIDQDIKTMYFVTDTLTDPGQRKNDIYRIGAISPNKTQKGSVESSKGNFYYMEFDTKNKRIVIENSKVNGELQQFTILLDAKNGTLSMTDGQRTLNMKAGDDRVTLENKANSCITMEGDTINVRCKKFNLEADESITMKTKKMAIETNSLEEKAKTIKFEHENVELKSKSTKSEIDSNETKCKTYKIDVPVLDCQADGLAVKGVIGTTGVAISTSPPSSNAPAQVPKGGQQIEMGQFVLKMGTAAINQNAGAIPLTTSTGVQQVVLQLCIEIDKAQAGVPMPPTASMTILPIAQKMASTSVQGS